MTSVAFAWTRLWVLERGASGKPQKAYGHGLERQSFGVGIVDVGQGVVDLVAVLLDGRAVGPVADQHQLLEHIGQFVVCVGDAVGDESLVEWSQVVRRTGSGQRYARRCVGGAVWQQLTGPETPRTSP